jgi:adenylate cyclase class 2
MIEVELKYKLSVGGLLDNTLVSLGARLVETRHERDSYYNHPCRDFAKTDEAVRIRQIENYNYITYKGPKINERSKTRFEIELQLSYGEGAALGMQIFLERLGFRWVGTIHKVRREWRLTDYHGFTVNVMQDRVEDLGAFLELEILAAEDRVAEAQDVLFMLAKELGLGLSERRSYLELLLAAQSSK